MDQELVLGFIDRGAGERGRFGRAGEREVDNGDSPVVELECDVVLVGACTEQACFDSVENVAGGELAFEFGGKAGRVGQIGDP